MRLGDIDAALRYADELESMSAPELGPTLPGDLARSVRAEVAVAQGRDRDALSILQDQRWVVPMDRTWGSPLRSRPHERFMRASILERLGRSEEALGWYASLGIRPYDLPYLAPSQLRQAEIYDSLGDGEKAALHYKRFIELWKDCDSELRPVVEQAERALERLTREPTTD
ncbi:MAG: hypothetical protein GWN32_18860 [Gemmatimonadetes bacterium]|nr:hypothetical protein [Gemmatimonadota bacterium]